MTHLLIVILGQRRHLEPLLEAWRATGVPGATILSSAGAFRAASWLRRLGLGQLESVFDRDDTAQPTLLAAIDDTATLDRAVAEAERIVGGFERSGNGLLLVLPITTAIGLRSLKPASPEADLAPALHPDWVSFGDRPVGEVQGIMGHAPTKVTADMQLDGVARAMVANSSVHVACVVDATGVLLGIIDLLSLADDLFVHIVPDEFLTEVTDLQDALRYADLARVRTAADAMRAPVWVGARDSCRDAFRRMHDQRLPGLPVVDDTRHVVGYLGLVELLAVCAGAQAPGAEESGAPR